MAALLQSTGATPGPSCHLIGRYFITNVLHVNSALELWSPGAADDDPELLFLTEASR